MPTHELLLAARSDLLSAVAHIDELLAASQPDRSKDKLDLMTLPRTQAIEHVLAGHKGPMRPVEIWQALRDAGRLNDPKMEVQVTTFDLWQSGRIGKVGRGQYIAKEQLDG